MDHPDAARPRQTRRLRALGRLARRRLAVAGLLAGLTFSTLPSGAAFADPWQPGPAADGDATLTGFVDSPGQASVIASGAFRLSGWVVDQSAQGWAGVDDVHVYDGRAGEGGTFLGKAQFAQARPDVARALGNPFWAASGFSLNVAAGRLSPGVHTLTVYAHTPGKGWWATGVTLRIGSGPAPSVAGVATSGPTSYASANATADQQRFIAEVGNLARKYRGAIGLPPSLVVAMAINESGWGKSTLSRDAFNFFGIKAHRGPGTAGVYDAPTWEVVDGQAIATTASFRAYYSLEESVRDLGTFLHTNSRYDPVFQLSGDPSAAARALLAAGYATDPAWADKLIRLVDLYQLRQLDTP